MKTLFLYVATIVAFISNTSVLANTGTATIKVELETHNVVFQNLSFDQIDDGSVVTGKIKKRSYNSRVSPGHIDYAIYDASGKLIDEGAVQYTPSFMLRRWKYGSSFSFKVPDNLPRNSTVKVSHHKNQVNVRTVSPPAPHSMNVLTQ